MPKRPVSARKSSLWYVSQPSRLGGTGKEKYRNQVLEKLIDQGYDVVHPFNAFPYDHFEGSEHVGRDMAMKYCCDLVDMCKSKIIVTGISEGVLLEVDYALQHPTPESKIIVMSEYDPEWNRQLEYFVKLGLHRDALNYIVANLD